MKLYSRLFSGFQEHADGCASTRCGVRVTSYTLNGDGADVWSAASKCTTICGDMIAEGSDFDHCAWQCDHACGDS